MKKIQKHLYIHSNGYYYFVRRIPTNIAKIIKEDQVRISLKTDSLTVARQKLIQVNISVEQRWSNIEKGMEFGDRYEDAKNIARSFGTIYQPVKKIIANEEETFRRVEILKNNKVDDPRVIKSLLGEWDAPKIDIWAMLDNYLEITKNEVIGLSKSQLRKRLNRKKRALTLLVDAVGAKNMADITRSDALAFKKYLEKTIKENRASGCKGLKDFETANKYITEVSTIFNTVNDTLDLGLSNCWHKMHFRGNIKIFKKPKKPPYPVDFVRDTLLNENNLKGLGGDAKLLIFALADTGARISELCRLEGKHIHLDCQIPYIEITNVGEDEIREDGTSKRGVIKTSHSKRRVPLVGASLYAFRKRPHGFKKYFCKNDTASTSINKHLNENKITYGRCKLNSLRHTMHDRMDAIYMPQDMQRQITGHSSKDIHETYGDGYTLAQMHEWMLKLEQVFNG